MKSKVWYFYYSKIMRGITNNFSEAFSVYYLEYVITEGLSYIKVGDLKLFLRGVLEYYNNVYNLKNQHTILSNLYNSEQ